MPFKPKEIVKALEKLGFGYSRQKGSHLHLQGPDGRLVTVPIHNKELKTGTFKSILKQAGISEETLRNSL